MKHLLLILTLVLSPLSNNIKAADSDLQRLAENLCEYSKSDNRASMRKKLKSARMRLKSIYSGIRCNGKTLLKVATDNNSIEAAKYILTKAGKKNIKEDDIIVYTKAILDSGDASKQEIYDLYIDKLN